MRSVFCMLVIIQVVVVPAAQGSSCHYRNGCTPPPDVCSVPSPDCQTDWSGTYCQMHNIARAKRASQSSTYSDGGVRYDAGRAVDGNVNTKFNHGSCSVTDELDGGHASWHVFLGGTFVISRITIYLRQDTIDHDQAMEVLVNNRTCRKLSVTDIRDSETHLISNPMTLSCTQPIEGDTVTVVMEGQYLALCEVQVFGKKKEPCHCSNGCSDFPNTPCSKPSVGTVCKPPWFGSFCQMENIAFQKATRQSSSYSESGRPFCAAYAIDGNTDTDFSQGSCSHTDNAAGSAASWQVLFDDHQMFNISRIRIYLRNGYFDRNQGLQVLVNGAPCNPASGARTDWTSGSVPNPLNITCQPAMRGNNVTITISGTYLALCEVQVFVCSDGWFGSDCSQQCQCLNTSEVCDKETGYCTSGCPAGKQGPGCQQVCSDGWFGSDCSKRCQCLDTSEVCDKETGYCRSGCAAGKQGPGCQQDCDQHFYGVNCSSACGQCLGLTDCEKDNGTCTQGCQPGYRSPYCKACVPGKFGVNCSATCGHCKDGPECDQLTGHCERGCLPGYVPPLCQKECGDYTYGLNCSGVCSCLNQCEVCDKVTGKCGTGYQKTATTTTTTITSTASGTSEQCQCDCHGPANPAKADNTGNTTDVRFIVVCCLMALFLVYSVVTTTVIIRLRGQKAQTQAELEKQYISLETRGESSVYDVIAGTHTYCNDVQPGNSNYENTNTQVKKRDENSL
ncbi:multiple epidermal growth factor-like domains protein 6 [Haliotis asinina]|uniref:multiple epidermal growth factor-like domains protein 6 n=1 Tax=Haliotis asinina TaxID=109174 RepID=UPI0035325FAE